MNVHPLRIVLADVFDYAGLFPPAELSMAETVANYARYTQAAEHWMVGRLIVPLARMSEFTAAFEQLRLPPATSWPLSVLAPATPDTFRSLAEWRATLPHQSDTLETKAATPQAIKEVAALRDTTTTVYVEVSVEQDPTALIGLLADYGLRGKIRTGGVTPDLFPTTDHVAQFIHACVAYNVPFKATAGLHHPLRNEYRLTYADHAPVGTMFGFMNVLVATAALQAGWAAPLVEALLESRQPEEWSFTSLGLTWRGQQLSLEQLQQARQLMISIGSCSFHEPVEDLQALAWLPKEDL